MSAEKKPQIWRAKLTHVNTSQKGSVLGNRMSRAEFEAWRDYEDKIETERYGTPSFRRELVLVDERGAEVSIEATLEAGEAERARLASQLETQRIAYLRGHETGAASMRKFLRKTD